MPDAFTRPVRTVDQALTTACTRRTTAARAHHRACADAEQAEQALMRAEQEVLLRERHVAMCDRSIEGLLDERLRAREAQSGALVH